MNDTIISEDRRRFLIKAATLLGVGLSAGSLAQFITACSSDNNSPVNVGNTQKDVDITQYPALQNDFGAVKVKFSGLNNNFPVIIIRKSAGDFLTLSSVCQHQGCEVGLPDSSTKKITCPCHGSVYSELDGSVINGPTTGPLVKFNNTFNASTNILTITL